MRRAGLLAVCLVLVGAFMVSADQLQWNSRAVCEQAMSSIKRASWIVLYCSLCDGDSAEIWSVKGVAIVPTSAGGLFELNVSGHRLGAFSQSMSATGFLEMEADGPATCESIWMTNGVDLAYTYVLTGDGSLQPLGRILGLSCRVDLETISLSAEVLRTLPNSL